MNFRILFWYLFSTFFLKGNSLLNYFLRKIGSQFRNSRIEIIRSPPQFETNHNINGFYGLIGSNINTSAIDSLYELFTGDGIIQGVFLENSNVTHINYLIQTDKVKFESKHGKLIQNMYLLPMYVFLNKFGIIPNILDLANTAFMKVKNSVYILFERDLPYEIKINFHNKTIETVRKVNISGIDNFSGHSRLIGNRVFSIGYDVVTNTVSCLQLDTDLKIEKKIHVKTEYIPVVHDFCVIGNSTLFTDSPLVYDMGKLLKMKIPIVFDSSKPTYFRLIDHMNGSQTVFVSQRSFYIFHYAKVREFSDRYEIYAPVYDSIDYSSLNMQGKYRCIVLNKHTRNVFFEKSDDLEKYNLDFPVAWRDKTILCNVENRRMNGFVICKDLSIVRTIMFEKYYLCGEPVVYDTPEFSRIISFAYDEKEKGYLLFIDPETGDVQEIGLQNSVKLGFHSIFVPRPI